jgi:hypothetical protein
MAVLAREKAASRRGKGGRVRNDRTFEAKRPTA